MEVHGKKDGLYPLDWRWDRPEMFYVGEMD